jgi:hypothetical protein
MVEADDQYWAHLAFQSKQCGAVDVSRQRYEAARTRAKARGFIYTPLPELTATIDVADLLKRLSHAVKHDTQQTREKWHGVSVTCNLESLSLRMVSQLERYQYIREAIDREIKSNASSRDIPLMGISLKRWEDLCHL